jgi:periplasmic divalent cation tolerance protein
MDISYILVQVSAASIEEATKIAEVVVEQKLVACAQIVPIRSVYFWQNVRQNEDEWLILMKTRFEMYRHLEACVQEIHSYELPEIIALPIIAGSSAYFTWIDERVIVSKP